jgi:RNA polymerase sigma factor (sigma-70 family)
MNVTMDDDRDWLTSRFEAARPHLRAVAYRILGSYADADDAVQETWLRLDRAEPDRVENFSGWLTTIVGRVCLDRLRSRQARREEPVGERPAEPLSTRNEELDPEQHALLAETVGSALLVVLDSLSPTERVVFVLHDLFAVPFAEVATIVNRSPDAARQLASRARRRLQGVPAAGPNLARQREVIDAFLAASREGDFHALLTLLDPDVIFRADDLAVRLGAPTETHGAEAVARATVGRTWGAQPGLIDGAVGLVWAPGGRTKVAFCFAITDGRIAAINMIANPEQVRELDIALLDDGPPGGPHFGGIDKTSRDGAGASPASITSRAHDPSYMQRANQPRWSGGKHG